jgi:hypothetical protein
MRRIASHLTYANVMVTILAFIVLTGGTAVALSGTNTVQSDDLGPGAQVKAPDVAAGAVGSAAVVNESLTGQDIKNQSGVDNCTHGAVRFGELCVGVANEHHPLYEAQSLCANLNLRLPSLGEALALATNYNLPNVDETEPFWTEETIYNSSTVLGAVVQDDGSFAGYHATTIPAETVCVTTPTN